MHEYKYISEFLGEHFLYVGLSPEHSAQGFQTTTTWIRKHFFRFAIAFTRQIIYSHQELKMSAVSACLINRKIIDKKSIIGYMHIM